ncbi:MAG: VOC family protein [Lachnospiraceae bacterium]|nr:VOC family protein [Lachnospiraceae bacterium]
MKYSGVLLVVKDINKSKEFYKDVLNLDVVDDFGENVLLTDNIYLQELYKWKELINNEEVTFDGNNQELYFEEYNFDEFIKKIESRNINLVHGVIEHSWGQRVIRFYDLDKHIIEVAEPMEIVIKRFIDNGLTIEETAKRMDVPIEYVNSKLKS